MGGGGSWFKSLCTGVCKITLFESAVCAVLGDVGLSRCMLGSVESCNVKVLSVQSLVCVRQDEDEELVENVEEERRKNKQRQRLKKKQHSNVGAYIHTHKQHQCIFAVVCCLH